MGTSYYFAPFVQRETTSCYLTISLIPKIVTQQCEMPFLQLNFLISLLYRNISLVPEMFVCVYYYSSLYMSVVNWDKGCRTIACD